MIVLELNLNFSKQLLCDLEKAGLISSVHASVYTCKWGKDEFFPPKDQLLWFLPLEHNEHKICFCFVFNISHSLKQTHFLRNLEIPPSMGL